MNDHNSPPDAPRTWRSAIRGNVLMLGLVSMLTDFASEMVNPLLPIFLAYLAGGAQAAFWVGLSEGIAETTASLLKIYSGRISDKAGQRKPLVVLGYGLSAFARPVTALVAAAWQVVGLKFVDRIGKGLRTSPRDALIGDSVPKEFRGLAFSFHRMMDHLGAVIGPLVAIAIFTWLLGYAKWGKTSAGLEVSLQEAAAMQLIFGLSIIPGVLAVLMILFKVREIPPATGFGSADGESVWKRLPRKFYAFVGIVTLFALGNSSDMFLLLYARDLFGLQLVPLVTLWIVLHLSKMVFSIPGGMISDKIGRRPVIVAGWIMYALVYLGMSLLNAQSPVSYFVALFIAYGFYFGMTEGAEKALVTDFIPSQFRGTAFGIYHGAVGLAALPASLLFGVFWTKIGPQVAFGVGASLAGAAAFLMTLLLSAKATQHAAAIGIMIAGGVVCLCAGEMAQRAAAGEAPAVRSIGNESQLLVDDVLLVRKTGVVREVHPCQKLPQPVLASEDPWEQDGPDQRVYVYGTVLRDGPAGPFRMWYNRNRLMLYATSSDGLSWERPQLGLYEYNGSKQNNIAFPLFHSPSVVYNPKAEDPAHRYNLLGYGRVSQPGYYAAHSADGLHWDLYPQNPVLSGGDACTLALDSATGEYLAFHKRTRKHAGQSRRLVYLDSA